MTTVRTSVLLATSCGLYAASSVGYVPSLSAQEATALDQVDPSGEPGAFFMSPPVDISSPLALSGFAWLGYAHRPLSLSSPKTGVMRDIVDHQLVLHAGLSLSFLERASIGFVVPSVISQSGDDPIATTFPSPDSAALGDIRLIARVVLLKQDEWAPGAMASFDLFLPTGDAGRYAGTGATRATPALTIGADYGPVRFSVGVARRFEARSDESLLGSNFRFNAAVYGVLAPFEFGPEFVLSTITDGSESILSRRTLHAEALLAAHAMLGPVRISLGLGPGFGAQPGVPDVRLIGGLSGSFEFIASSPQEAELPPEDASARSADARPGLNMAKVSTGGSDGVKKPPTSPHAIDGAPPKTAIQDADADGLADASDACPNVAGIFQGDPNRDGCPADRDGDSVPDVSDRCPDAAGDPAASSPTLGCPRSVRLEQGRIAILERVNFKTASADIEPTSFALLDEVRATIEANPSLARLAVDGHTDGVGAPNANLTLSRKRALAVVRYLTEKGIDPRRLEARGFGPKQPIADNGTEEGRLKNRRVEFIILLDDPAGSAAWIDGSLPAARPTEGEAQTP